VRYTLKHELHLNNVKKSSSCYPDNALHVQFKDHSINASPRDNGHVSVNPVISLYTFCGHNA